MKGIKTFEQVFFLGFGFLSKNVHISKDFYLSQTSSVQFHKWFSPSAGQKALTGGLKSN